MKTTMLALVLALISVSASASGQQDCEELRDRIAAKLESKKVASYSLEIVEAKGNKTGKGSRVVGTCEMGSKKVIYSKA